jgi:hypothetical protein
VWLALFADATAVEALCWLALPPVETFDAVWVDVAEAVALCSVGASWTIVCDCPSPPAPPLCVAVTLWVVLLSFSADEEALEELVCSALLPGSVESAAAVPGAKPVKIANKAVHASRAPQRASPSPMSSTIADLLAWEQTPAYGFDSPRPGGGKSIRSPAVPTQTKDGLAWR